MDLRIEHGFALQDTQLIPLKAVVSLDLVGISNLTDCLLFGVQAFIRLKCLVTAFPIISFYDGVPSHQPPMDYTPQEESYSPVFVDTFMNSLEIEHGFFKSSFWWTKRMRAAFYRLYHLDFVRAHEADCLFWEEFEYFQTWNGWKDVLLGLPIIQQSPKIDRRLAREAKRRLEAEKAEKEKLKAERRRLGEKLYSKIVRKARARKGFVDADDECEEQSPLINIATGLGIAATALLARKTFKVLDRFEEVMSRVPARNDVESVMRNLNSATETMAETAGGLGSAFASLKKVMTDMYESLKKNMAVPIAGVCLIAITLWWLRCRRAPPMVVTLVKTAVMNRLDACNITDVAAFYVDDSQVEQQGGASNGIAGACLAFLLASTGLKDFGLNAGMASNLMRSIGAAPRAFEAVDGFVQWLLSAIGKMIDFVRKMFNMPALRFFQKNMEGIENLAAKVYECEADELSGKTKLSPDQRLNRIMALHHDVLHYKNVYRGHRDMTYELDTLMRVIVRLSGPLRQTVGSGSGYCQLPLSVLVYSKPGIGKTMTVQAIVAHVLKEAELIDSKMSIADVEKLIFTKPFNSEYMDGYYGQPVYLMDDFMMQKMTAQDKSNGILDLMTYYSSFTQLVNMAACENKGMFPFSSKIIMMTTNMKEFAQVGAQDHMLSVPAIERRIDIHYELVVREQYRRTGSLELDYDKFEDELARCARTSTSSSFPWHIWEAFPLYFGADIPSVREDGAGVPMLDMLKKMIEKLRMRKQSYATINKVSQDILSSPMDEQSPPFVFPEDRAPTYEVFNATVETDFEEIKKTYRQMMREAHPDKGGCTEEAARLNDAYEYIEDWEHRKKGIFGEQKPLGRFMLSLRRLMRKHFQTICLVCALLINVVVWVASYYLVKALLNLVIGMFTSVVNWVMSLFTGKSEPEEQSNQAKAPVNKNTAVKQSDVIDGMHSTIYKNSFKLIVDPNGPARNVQGQVTFLKRDYAIMPLHFYKRIQKALDEGVVRNDTPLHLVQCVSASNIIKLTVRNFMCFDKVTMEDRDICVMRLKSVYTAKDAFKFVVKRDDFRHVGNLSVRLDVCRYKDCITDLPERMIFNTEKVEIPRGSVLIGDTVHSRLLSYDASTIVGDCGAPLTLQQSNRFDCRIWIGLHVGAMRNSKAFATQIDAESLGEAIDHLMKVTADPVVEELSLSETVQQSGLVMSKDIDLFEDETKFADDDFGSIEVAGRLSVAVATSVKSGIVKTIAWDLGLLDSIPEVGALVPMRLAPYTRDGEVVFPMVKSLLPYGGMLQTVDTVAFKHAVFIAMEPFAQATVHVSGCDWTFEEAFLGANAGKGLPKSTSVGYPLCVDYKKKTTLFDMKVDDDWDFGSSSMIAFRGQIERLEEMMEKGVRPYFIARAFLKDELRKPTKSARYIAGTALHYYVLCRMYFGQFVTSQMNTFKSSGMCPGINPYQDWEWLRNHVTRNGPHVWDGDFAGFDVSQQPQMLHTLGEYIVSWYGLRGASARSQKIRRMLLLDLFKSRHAVGRAHACTHVVQWQRSLPSGHFLTTTINSMLSLSAIVGCYADLTLRNDFWETSSAATMGDDNVTGTSSELVDVFNQRTVAEAMMRLYGLTYTAAAKDGKLVDAMSIDEITFLQRSFRVKDKVVVAPIALKSIYSSLAYTKRGDAKYQLEVASQNIEGMLCEISLYPEVKWPSMIEPVLTYARALGLVPRFDVESSLDYFRFTCQREQAGWF